jgi:alanine racemase
LEQFIQYIQAQGLHHFPVHLKLNTGMNRLGFDPDQVDLLSTCLHNQQALKVQTIFSHLSASGQTAFEGYTQNQLLLFHQMAAKIENAIGYKTTQHIANSGAILMDAKYHLDMVRLGIGLYGIAPAHFHFETVVQFNTTIAQIRTLKAGETVGYNRAGVLNRDSLIATVRLGYADGYSRQLGRGIGAMWVHGHLAPIVGDICMDMTMIDITDIPNTKEGDLVEVFGANLPIEKVAKWANTIPYEILTSIGQRVKRIYIQD